MDFKNPDIDKKVAETAEQIAAHLADKEATPDEIATELDLQLELVNHALMKHGDLFEWSIRGGDFKKAYKAK